MRHSEAKSAYPKTEPGDRVSLDHFLQERAPDIAAELQCAGTKVKQTADYLGAALLAHPELAAQVRRLGDAVPQNIEGLDVADRNAATSEADEIAADIKTRWISAENPPLVDEIDDRLAEIAEALETLRRPGPEALRATASEIERLHRRTAHLDGIEQRYIPWATAAAVLFVLGLITFFFPAILDGTVLASPWTILACLGALPAIGIHYARTVLPRSQTDTAIDVLNGADFVPLGGLYFPEGDRPACVVIIAPAPEQTDGQQARAERRRHRERVGPFW